MNTNKPDGGPAYPVPIDQNENGFPCVLSTGMSMRDWFAGMALQGIIAAQARIGESDATMAAWAFAAADAMIQEREKK